MASSLLKEYDHCHVILELSSKMTDAKILEEQMKNLKGRGFFCGFS